jgi:hypothetical protein
MRRRGNTLLPDFHGELSGRVLRLYPGHSPQKHKNPKSSFGLLCESHFVNVRKLCIYVNYTRFFCAYRQQSFITTNVVGICLPGSSANFIQPKPPLRCRPPELAAHRCGRGDFQKLPGPPVKVQRRQGHRILRNGGRGLR